VQPASNAFGQTRDLVGSPAQVLERHGVQVRGRMACCPIHEDHTPSLSIFRGHDGVDRWRCHGCGAHGDAIDLEAVLSGRSLSEVLRAHR
jgi:DNA primase